MATDTKRRTSVSTRDSSEHASGPPPVHLSQPHTRRMSRMENPNFHMAHAARRMSMYRRPSLAGSQLTSLSHSVVAPVKLQNTYHLEPQEDEKFMVGRVSKALHSILESFLEGEDYEQKKCAALSQNLTDVIKSRIKEMHFPRYKFVCHVIIGQQGNQCMQATSRCVWNTDTDTYAQGSYSNSSLFAVASVYGCYFE